MSEYGMTIKQAELAIAAVHTISGEGWQLDGAECRESWHDGERGPDIWSVRASWNPRRYDAPALDEHGAYEGEASPKYRNRHTRDEEMEISIHLDRPTLREAVDDIVRYATEVSR